MLRILARDVAVACRRCPAALAQATVALDVQLAPSPSAAQLSWHRGFCSAETAPPPDLFNAKVRSLAFDRLKEEPSEEAQSHWLTRLLLKAGGYYSKESTLLRGAKALYEGIREQSSDPQLLKAISLQPTFAQEHMLLSLHVWMLLVRLRAEGPDGKNAAQLMYEEFTEDVEARLRNTGVKVRIGKHLAELEKMFYGSSMAYDKALKGEDQLSAAVLRNIFNGEEGRRRDAAALARYIQWELACLSKTDSQSVLNGKLKFSTDFDGDSR